MMDGKISAASTRASREVATRETASSGSCWRADGACSARFGMTLASTSTIILVNSRVVRYPRRGAQRLLLLRHPSPMDASNKDFELFQL